MKVIIAGSRKVTDFNEVAMAVKDSGFDSYGISEIVSGAARGVDRLGEKYAEQNWIPLKRFPANWKVFGVFAGKSRNSEMAKYADALVAVWDGKSRGTEDMIIKMLRLNKPVHVHRVK